MSWHIVVKPVLRRLGPVVLGIVLGLLAERGYLDPAAVRQAVETLSGSSLSSPE